MRLNKNKCGKNAQFVCMMCRQINFICTRKSSQL